MKFTKFLFITLLSVSFMFVQSCTEDDPEPDPIDFTALETAINTAEDLVATTTEGTAEGQYVLGSQEILQTAIDLAQNVLDSTDPTQTAVDNAVIALNAAIALYNDSKIVPVDPDNLVGHWTFDEGSGTTVSDFSGNGFAGTFGSVEGFGAGTPEWTTDRYGNATKAILFDKGAKITVPYNTSLNPGMMSISLWVNAAENRENNRFMGLHSWNGFKFQLQAADKAFFTGATTEGIFDKDTDPPLNLNTWYHLAVTMGDGNMVFYVNGTRTQVWDDTPGTMAAVLDHDLVFGVASSQYAATADNYDVDKIIPLAWGGYFNGALDEIRMYKSILTESQVQSIYDTEKAP